MKKWLIIFFITCACIKLHAQVQIITTIAGKAGVPASYFGDNVVDTSARFYGPCSICRNNSNSVFIVDAYNNRVRKIDLNTNIITTIAGNDTFGYFGDGGLATATSLWLPEGICADTFGNVYVADAYNSRIRRVNTITGVISTVAGNGTIGFSGDGALAINAQINLPADMCTDRYGNVYFSDYLNYRVRKINMITGKIETVAGCDGIGYSGDGGPATNAKFNGPGAPLVDTSGNIFICDMNNNVVRKVDAVTGIIATVAGNGTVGHSGDNGLAIHAQLNNPSGLQFDSQYNLYIAEFGNGVIRRIDATTGIITTVAGNGVWGWAGDGGPPTEAELSCTGLVFDKYGQMIIADYGTNTIREIINPKLVLPDISQKNETVSVYPNPSNDEVTVDYTLGGDALFEITDVVGRKLVKNRLDHQKQKIIINIRSFPQGIYVYKVYEGCDLIASGKIVKE